MNKRNGRIWKKIRRGVCIFLSFLTFVLVIGGIILFVVPELVNSVKVLTDNAPSYINRLMQETTKLLEKVERHSGANQRSQAGLVLYFDPGHSGHYQFHGFRV